MGSMSEDMKTYACLGFPEEMISHRSNKVHMVEWGSHHCLLTCCDTAECSSQTLQWTRGRSISEAGPPVVYRHIILLVLVRTVAAPSKLHLTTPPCNISPA